MKKLFKSIFQLAIIASLGFFASCNEDGEELPDFPVVSFTSSVLDDVGYASLEPGDVLSFTITVDAPGVFNNLTMEYYQDGVEVVDSDSTISRDPGTSPLEYTSDQFRFEISNDDVGIVHTLVFQAADDAGQLSNELTLTVDVSSPEAKVQTAVMLFAPSADSLTKTFYSIENNMTYSIFDINTSSEPISAGIDLGYFYGAEANLVSPSDYVSLTSGVYDEEIAAWGTKNSTSLVLTTLTTLEDVVSVADVEDALSSVSFEAAPTKIEGVTTNTIYAFKTSADLMGLVKVISILEGDQVGANPNNPDVTGNIELEFILGTAAE